MTQNPHSHISRVKDRMIVQYVRNGVIYASEDNYVFKSPDNGLSWSKVCRLAAKKTDVLSRIKDSILRMEPVRRVRRNIGIHNVVVLPSGTVLIQYDGIYRYDGTSAHAQKVFDFRPDNIIGPIKNGFVVDDRTGHIYWGEYNIARPYSVRLFRGSRDGLQWEECYRFASGQIRHVHTIVPDPFRERLWICTGDNDQETGLFYTTDDFQTLHRFNGGDQSWRMVSMIPMENALYWGSDAGQDAPPDAVNYMYKWDFTTGRKERGQLIDKPAYYATVLKNGTMAIGVHHEPKIKRTVEPSADLWISSNGGDTWHCNLKLPYAPAGRKQGTQYATIYLPQGDQSAETLFFTPLNTRNTDFSLMKVRL